MLICTVSPSRDEQLTHTYLPERSTCLRSRAQADFVADRNVGNGCTAEKGKAPRFIFCAVMFEYGREISSEGRLAYVCKWTCSKIGPIERTLVGGLDAWSWVGSGDAGQQGKADALGLT
jgi:hypothetical protein